MEYKKKIIELIKDIHEERYLVYIYTFIKQVLESDN